MHTREIAFGVDLVGRAVVVGGDGSGELAV